METKICILEENIHAFNEAIKVTPDVKRVAHELDFDEGMYNVTLFHEYASDLFFLGATYRSKIYEIKKGV